MNSVRIIISGGRTFKDCDLLEREMDLFIGAMKDVEIISGGQVTIDEDTGERYGADYLGEQYAKKRGYKLTVMNAEWNKYGKPAGPIRNRKMAKYANGVPYSACVVFWNGESRGSKDMILNASINRLVLKVIKYAQ